METHGQNKINCPCRTIMSMLSTRVGIYLVFGMLKKAIKKLLANVQF